MQAFEAEVDFQCAPESSNVDSVDDVPTVPAGVCQAEVYALEAQNQGQIAAELACGGDRAFLEWLVMARNSRLCPDLEAWLDAQTAAVDAMFDIENFVETGSFNVGGVILENEAFTAVAGTETAGIIQWFRDLELQPTEVYPLNPFTTDDPFTDLTPEELAALAGYGCPASLAAAAAALNFAYSAGYERHRFIEYMRLFNPSAVLVDLPMGIRFATDLTESNLKCAAN
jgi:hypothetical protein